MTGVAYRLGEHTDPLADWRDHAACHGLGAVMDPPNPTPQQIGEAAAICLRCPVMDDCRTWVMSLPEKQDPGGVCAGMSELSRKKRRQRANGRAIQMRRTPEERRASASRAADSWRVVQKARAEAGADRYAELAARGYTQERAAAELGVPLRTIERYAARLRAREVS